MTNYFRYLIIVGIIIVSGKLAYADQIKILHQSSNEFGPTWVFQDREEICLSFVPPGTVVQSCMIAGKPEIMLFDYTHLMLSSLLVHEKPQKILMIGLGGASIAKAINILLPKVEIDIVEINPLIPELAKEFFAFNQSSTTKIHVVDGIDFVKKAKYESYDVILLDAFTKDYIPPSMLSEEFTLGLKKILKKGGVITVNTFEKSPLHDQETKLFTKVFGKIYSMTSTGNRVILAKKGELPDLKDIENYSAFWRFRLAQIGINQLNIAEILQKTKEHHN